VVLCAWPVARYVSSLPLTSSASQVSVEGSFAPPAIAPPLVPSSSTRTWPVNVAFPFLVLPIAWSAYTTRPGRVKRTIPAAVKSPLPAFQCACGVSTV